MKIVIAPDAFKESMSALEVAEQMEKGIKKVSPLPQIFKRPIADGGEGTVQVLLDAFNGEKIEVEVTGPLGKSIKSYYGIVDEKIAVIEIAAVCGLMLIPNENRNPMETTSYGIGELILDALNRGIREFIIGLGGSGTNDGGIGMAQALGAQITDMYGEPVRFGGKGLQEVVEISLKNIDSRLKNAKIKIASDVSNPLLGIDGGTYVYGPQKGADDTMVEALDQAMAAYASILKRDVGMDITITQGAGAAGGLGAACIAFLGASLQPGIELITSLINLDTVIKDAQLILTGEGRVDDQTSFGKAIAGVAQIAQRYDVPVVAITGANHTTSDAIYDAGITAIFTLPNEPMSLEEAIDNGPDLIEKVTENVWRLFNHVYEKR